MATQGNWRTIVRASYKLHSRFAFSSLRANDLLRLGSLRGGDNRNSRFNNSRFFTGDFSKRVSQPFFMIKVDLCNYRDIRLNGVGRIEPPADSRFKNDDVDVRFGKTFQRKRGRDFEKRRMRIPIGDQVTNRGQSVGSRLLGNHFAIEANPLPERDEVRGCKKPDAISSHATDRIDHCANGAFAVCAGDVDDLPRKGNLQIAHGGLEAAAP